jgi:hypothetical protein
MMIIQHQNQQHVRTIILQNLQVIQNMTMMMMMIIQAQLRRPIIHHRMAVVLLDLDLMMMIFSSKDKSSTTVAIAFEKKTNCDIFFVEFND